MASRTIGLQEKTFIADNWARGRTRRRRERNKDAGSLRRTGPKA
jgi:hypothetical protein